jgi:hypothetical protein
MWLNIPIVALLLGTSALIGRAGRRTRSLTWAAGTRWVKLVEAAVKHLRSRRARPAA